MAVYNPLSKISEKSLKLKQTAIYSYVGILVLYVLLNFVTAPQLPSSKTYHLSDPALYALLVAILLPIAAIWFAAFYGYAQLKEYAHYVRKSSEGNSFDQLATGVQWLAWGLPISYIVSTVLTLISIHHPAFYGPSTIIKNYLILFISLVAFAYLGRGTRSFLENSNSRASQTQSRVIMLIFSLLGVVYCYLTFRTVDPRIGDNSVYYLPVWLLIITVVVPYLYAWFMGLVAAFEMSIYKNNVKGVIYKQAMGLVSQGVIFVIATSIIIQYMNSASPLLKELPLNYYLMIIYGLLVLYALGFVLIALGSKKLKKLEEV